MSMEKRDNEESEWKSETLSGSTTDMDAVGNKAISSTIRAVSKPRVSSWRYISIGKSYDNSYNYDRSKESHLMKNSEWGAVVYLAHSQYGRNGTKITQNNNSSYITAGGTDEKILTTNADQSTTGNESGIYDLSGGVWERVTGYITNGNENLKIYGLTTVSFPLVSTFSQNTEAYKTLSTKYSTVYPVTTEDTRQKNGEAYKNANESEENYGYGDAILETSTGYEATTSWFKAYSNILFTNEGFMIRGGSIYDRKWKFCIQYFEGTL